MKAQLKAAPAQLALRDPGPDHCKGVAMVQRTCSIEGCGKPHLARGYCNRHYLRFRTHGDPLGGGSNRYQNPDEAFKARTERQGECLVWTGSLNSAGYGTLTAGRIRQYAHRYAWEQAHGPIPDGMEIDHICHRPACVEVSHLRMATRQQNVSSRGGAEVRNRSTGIRNVYRAGGKYTVHIKVNGVAQVFGSYSNVEEAAAVARARRAELFGEFAGRG